MENKLKHFNLGIIEPEFIPAVWEYSDVIEPTSPVIFSYTPGKTATKMSGSGLMSDLIKVEEIPADVSMIRVPSPRNACFIVDPGLQGFIIHFPDTVDFQNWEKAIKAIVFKILRANGIPLIERGNDVFFEKDGLEKKFFGMMERQTRPGWKVAVFSVTFKFNSDLANKIYKFDNEKFTKKGEITDISKIVGGISEVNPDIDRVKLVEEIVKKLADRYDWSIESAQLSEEDRVKMNEVAEKLKNKDWILYARNLI